MVKSEASDHSKYTIFVVLLFNEVFQAASLRKHASFPPPLNDVNFPNGCTT